MNKVIELFKNQKEVKTFFELPDFNNTLITSTTIPHNLLLTAAHFYNTNETIIYVANASPT